MNDIRKWTVYRARNGWIVRFASDGMVSESALAKLRVFETAAAAAKALRQIMVAEERREVVERQKAAAKAPTL